MLPEVIHSLSTKKSFSRKSRAAKKTEPSKNSFSQSLTNEINEIEGEKNLNNQVQLLVSDLNHLGEILKEDPSLKNFARYQATLEVFFKSLTKKSFGLKKINSLDKKTLVQKEFHIVTIINLELESLLALIVQEQKNNIAIAAKIVKIKGMLLDHFS